MGYGAAGVECGGGRGFGGAAFALVMFVLLVIILYAGAYV